jgi:hypothetical protein
MGSFAAFAGCVISQNTLNASNLPNSSLSASAEFSMSRSKSKPPGLMNGSPNLDELSSVLMVVHRRLTLG